MPNQELAYLSISEASQLIAKRQITPVELTQACLDRIERFEPSLNCFITLCADAALDQARQVEESLVNAPTNQNALLGIPLALKDLYETEGVLTTGGSKFFKDHIPENNAFVVDKLRAAGAIHLGKLNMHEIALGVTTINPHFGTCRNPWAIDRIPGGSSGGSGAALAAGFCLGSLGSDTGGSIRIPAALCGITGLKPTYGRVSLRGVIPLSWSLDHAGPMARQVKDVALLLQTIAGYDPADPASQDRPVDDYLSRIDAGVNRWRIAVADDAFFQEGDPQVLQAVEKATRVFEQLGAKVQRVPLGDARKAAQANGLMVVSEAAAFHLQRLQARPEDFGESVRPRLHTGAATPALEYVQARRTQTELRRQFELFFDNHDILLTPTTPLAALPIQENVQPGQLTRYTAPFNLTGFPALSLPCGFTTSGLPVGLQIVARPWAEATVLRAGYAYEQATEWHLRRPTM